MKKPRAQVRKVPDSSAGAVETVNEIASAIGGRLRNVKSNWVDGSTRLRELRLDYLGHRIAILADRQSIMVDIEAQFGQFTLVYINPWKELRWEGCLPACIVNAEGIDYELYTYGNKLSQDQFKLVETGIIGRLLSSIQLRPEEMMNLSQRLVRFDLKNPSVDRVLKAIQAVIRLMPHESIKKFQPYDDLPNEFRPLIALILKWSVSDDKERDEKIRRAARSTRISLVKTVLPLVPEINRYLDTFHEPLSPEACELGYLVEAALEAQISLDAGAVEGGH